MRKRIRLEFFGDEIDAITRFDPLTGQPTSRSAVITFYPAKQFVTPADKMQSRACARSAKNWKSESSNLEVAEQTSRSATAADAHRIRSGNDAGNGLLQRDRKLLTPFVRTPAGLEAVHVDRFFPERFSARHR